MTDVEGILTINLTPPSLVFTKSGEVTTRHCQVADVYKVLLELGVENKPMRECVARLHGRFPAELLRQYGLLHKRVS